MCLTYRKQRDRGLRVLLFASVRYVYLFDLLCLACWKQETGTIIEAGKQRNKETSGSGTLPTSSNKSVAARE